jgi:uncharacterized protein (DUF2141 family)
VRRGLPALGGALLCLTSGLAAAGPVEVVVTNLRAPGTVLIALCPEATFLTDECPIKGTAPAVAGQATVVLADVAPGVYAAQGFLDENDNREVDRTLLGIPEEGVGFSRDPSYFFAPPAFADAAVTLGPAGGRITMRLRYFD